MEIHLGHGGAPCLSADVDADVDADISEDEEEAWEDADLADMPAHLKRPANRNYITIVDTSGIHFCNLSYCTCAGAPEKHVQLFRAQLFAPSTIRPQTAFTFRVLDDFLRDNVECGTSALNYFTKLRRITSNAFPHMVPVCRCLFLTRLLFNRCISGSLSRAHEGCQAMAALENHEMEWIWTRRYSANSRQSSAILPGLSPTGH